MSPARVAQWVESADVVIAADSGLLRVLEAGYVPDIVIGDFDSVSLDMIDRETRVIHDSGQENTDCAKLLDFVESEADRNVTLICAEGDLTDHFLDTLHSAVRSNLDVVIGLDRGHAHILKGPVSQTFSATVGKRVSFIPLETISHASLSGVQWSFEDQTLSVRGFTSISNASIEPLISVAFHDGSGYLFIESDEVYWP